jgi:hypothetical protein
MNTDGVTVLDVCPDHLAACIMVNFLRAEGVLAVARNLSAVPGLEQGTEVLVPTALLHRARWLLAQQQTSEAELTCLATGTPPESDADSGPK